MFWLVVYLPLWKIWKSVGMIIPNIRKNKIHVPNHQSDYFGWLLWIQISWQQKHIAKPISVYRKLPSGYLTVCHRSHGPQKSMVYLILPIKNGPWLPWQTVNQRVIQHNMLLIPHLHRGHGANHLEHGRCHATFHLDSQEQPQGHLTISRDQGCPMSQPKHGN